MNGKPAGKVKKTVTTLIGNQNPVILGNQFKGNIDEIRLWDKALTYPEIKNNYNRNLMGSEKGLKAYYTFNFAVDKAFYDMSFAGNTYNENHGTGVGSALDAVTVPTPKQLGYKGITASDGSYAIISIPYSGNGTAYSIIPRLGIHTFEPMKEIRFIGPGAQTHTVNFTDKSSFNVSGKVIYKSGTIPVEGVMFQVDGKTAMQSNGTIIQTNAEGKFTISVPVGIHEVKAVKNNHTFENGGRITYENGLDRNYQDILTGVELIDTTIVRYTGRVAGGTIQAAYPMGHSLSKNNLAQNIQVDLEYQNPNYNISNKSETKSFRHNKKTAFTNKVNYNQKHIIISVNDTTGEFVADVIPQVYYVKVKVNGHDNGYIAGNNSILDFSNSFAKENSVHNYTDGIKTNGDKFITKNFSDTVFFNKQSNFNLRHTPKITITQLNKQGQPVDYFGNDSLSVNTVLSQYKYGVKLYDASNKKYTLGYPVFIQCTQQVFRAKLFEEYAYISSENKILITDEVPTQDAKIEFGSELTGKPPKWLKLNDKGFVNDTIQIGNPSTVDPRKLMTASASYGAVPNSTIISWDGGQAIITGANLKGTDFITQGPDKILFVLRDPPRSNSYSFLEKGTVFTENSTYAGEVKHTGSVMMTFKQGVDLTTFAGIGAGVINENETELSMGGSVNYEQIVNGTSGKKTTVSTTTRFQTGSSPDFVGADGDVYVGYSTNLSFGATDAINIIPKARYEALKGDSKYTVYTAITPETSEWLLVKETGVGISQDFKTLFAFPQSYIENTLIPQIKNYQNHLLVQNDGKSDYQSLANTNKKAIYVSKRLPTDEKYGKSNTDTTAFKDKPDNPFDGESYKIYFPDGAVKLRCDTILLLNQSINNWIKHLTDNEKKKSEALVEQNYSFHSGAPISYTKAYSSSQENTQTFSVLIGAELASKVGFSFDGIGFEMEIKDKTELKNGGSWSQSQENSKSMGFLLDDANSNDYLSVDVCHQAANDSSTFIFRTRAGATSCPHESGYKTK